ncbi:MAG: hypothetical protein Q9191_002078 [Dirinaria sp. TL-2023a]
MPQGAEWLADPESLDRSVSLATKNFLLGYSSQLKFSSYRYDAPHDLITYPQRDKSIDSESLIAKVTILFHGKDPTYVRAIQSHQAHNRRFGYPLFVLRHGILDGIWNKPVYLLAILLEELRKPEARRLKWLLWVDADTVVTNPKLPLDIFLPPDEFPHLHLLTTADPNGLNNGIFFLKVHPWSVELLSSVIAYRIFRPDEELRFRDQSALQVLLKEKRFRRNFVIVPQRWFNAYQPEHDGSRTLPFQILPGDLLVHFAGVPNRGPRMRVWLDRAEKHLPEWELELEYTNHLNETKIFWADQLDVLAKERSEAQSFMEPASELLARTKQQLSTHSRAIDSGELEQVEKHVKQLMTSLDEYSDDPETIKDAYQNLRKSAFPLQEAIEAPKKEAHRQARAALSKGKQRLLQPASSNAGNGGGEEHLRSKIDFLERLLLEVPDDVDAIRKAVDDIQYNHKSGASNSS